MAKQRVHTTPESESQGIYTCNTPHDQLHGCREGKIPRTHESTAEEKDERRTYDLCRRVCWWEVVGRYAIVGSRGNWSEEGYAHVHEDLRVVAPHDAAEPLGAADEFKGSVRPGLEGSGARLCWILAHKSSYATDYLAIPAA